MKCRRRRSPELGFASALLLFPLSIQEETWKVHVVLSPWVQLTLPLLSPSLHEPPCCFLGRGFCFVYRRHSWAQGPLSWQLFCLRFGYSASRSWNSLPPTVWMTRMGQETGGLQFHFRLFLVLLNTHRINTQSSRWIGKGILFGSTFSLQG